jgi:hypothetical protein
MGRPARRGLGTRARDPGVGFFTTCGGVLREGVPMKYRAIREHSRRYPIRLMCRALAVSAAGLLRVAHTA